MCKLYFLRILMIFGMKFFGFVISCVRKEKSFEMKICFERYRVFMLYSFFKNISFLVLILVWMGSIFISCLYMLD